MCSAGRMFARVMAPSHRHSQSGILHDRPQLGVAVLPELYEARVMLVGLLPLVLPLVDLGHAQGVGPLYPSVDSYVRLVVEKYAGLSTVSLQRN
jgi:hypothetical protein